MKMLLTTLKSVRLALVVCTFMFLSCTDEMCKDEVASESRDFYFWSPNLSVEKGDGEALLMLSDPTPYTQYAGPAPTHPDFYNILISEDLEMFRLYKRVDYSETTIVVKDLANDKPYYFKVAAEKGQETQDSRIVMTIPSKQLPVEPFLPSEYASYVNLSKSYDGSYLSFVTNGEIYFTTLDEGAQPFIDKNSGGASWSQEANKAVYVTHEQQKNVLYISQFKVFDATTNSATELFQIPYDRYYAANPKFIPASNDVSFLSNEETSDATIYDLWRIDPATKEKTRITNLAQRGFIGASNYDWTDTGTSIYIDGLKVRNEPWGIFQFDVATNSMSPIIRSLWNDQHPSLSPDDMKIAFVSDRSGRDEIWIYDITGDSYRQVTGSNAFNFDSRYSNLQWFDKSRLLITAWLDGEVTSIAINVD
jgi:hypothetical protein